MKERYWKLLTNNKFALYYLDEHFGCYTKRDRILNIILVITSSSAIASWAVWQSLAFLWGLIIVLSQVLSMVNRYLPYKKRIKEISNMKMQLTPIYNEIEYKWFKVANGICSENEINDLIYNFNKKWTEINEQFFIDDNLPYNKTFEESADAKKNTYFANLF